MILLCFCSCRGRRRSAFNKSHQTYLSWVSKYIHLVEAVVVVCGIRLNFTFGTGHDARSLSVVTHGLAESSSLQNVPAGQSPMRVKSRTPFASQGITCRRLILKDTNGFLMPFMMNCTHLKQANSVPRLHSLHIDSTCPTKRKADANKIY